MDFTRQAVNKGASARPGHGSRVVVTYNGKTIGYSNHGNKPYSREYRRLLLKAFAAAGLLSFLILLVRHAV
jgi:hypothetical protein